MLEVQNSQTLLKRAVKGQETTGTTRNKGNSMYAFEKILLLRQRWFMVARVKRGWGISILGGAQGSPSTLILSTLI